MLLYDGGADDSLDDSRLQTVHSFYGYVYSVTSLSGNVELRVLTRCQWCVQRLLLVIMFCF